MSKQYVSVLGITYPEVLQEADTVHQRERVEDIKASLLRADERVADDVLEALLQTAALLRAGLERGLRGVIEQVCGVEQLVLVVVHDRRRERVERDEVGDLVCLRVLCIMVTRISARTHEYVGVYLTSTTYAQTTCPSRRIFQLSDPRGPSPRPLRNWWRTSSSLITGNMVKRFMYRLNRSVTCGTSRSSISRSPWSSRRGRSGSLCRRIMRASVMLEGTLVNRTETSLGMFRQRWKYLDSIQAVRMEPLTSSVGHLPAT